MHTTDLFVILTVLNLVILECSPIFSTYLQNSFEFAEQSLKTRILLPILDVLFRIFEFSNCFVTFLENA